MKTPDWVTACGDEIPLACMTADHIQNAMSYLHAGTGEFGPMVRSGCSGFSNAEWMRLFTAELGRRNRFSATSTQR
jgi:hypothetical protein